MPGPIHWSPPRIPQNLGGMLGAAYVSDPEWKPGKMAGEGKPWIGKPKGSKRR